MQYAISQHIHHKKKKKNGPFPEKKLLANFLRVSNSKTQIFAASTKNIPTTVCRNTLKFEKSEMKLFFHSLKINSSTLSR